MVVIAAMGVASWAFGQFGCRFSYSYAAGWWEAERELWRGNATVYYFSMGCVWPGDVCNLDLHTGLPVRIILIDLSDRDRLRGHNDHIQQYIRWHGLPGNTFKPWEAQLFGLRRFFDEQSARNGPIHLVVGEPAASSPDGRNNVRPLPDTNRDGTRGDGLKIVIMADNVAVNDWLVRSGKGDSDLYWGPPGSRFVVIRSISKAREEFKAYDLRSGRLLRTETWEDHKPIAWTKAVKIKVTPGAQKSSYGDLMPPLIGP
jgi:hypothetical protein